MVHATGSLHFAINSRCERADEDDDVESQQHDSLELDPTLGWLAGGGEYIYLRLATRSDSLPYYDNLGQRLQGLVAHIANSKLFQPLVSTISGAVHGWGKGE